MSVADKRDIKFQSSVKGVEAFKSFVPIYKKYLRFKIFNLNPYPNCNYIEIPIYSDCAKF